MNFNNLFPTEISSEAQLDKFDTLENIWTFGDLFLNCLFIVVNLEIENNLI